MGTHHPIRKTVAPEIPDKLYFRIGDVARLCEVPAYVLRFWETEFPQLKPNKGGTGQRLYRKRDVEMALRIKSLLYDQGYTIPGARQVFKSEAKPGEAKPGEAKTTEIKPKEGVLTMGLSAPASAAAPAGEGESTLTAMRRATRLQALRAELAALHATLSRPVAGAVRDSNVQSMRPRLTLERAKSSQLSLEGDLF